MIIIKTSNKTSKNYFTKISNNNKVIIIIKFKEMCTRKQVNR